MAKLVRRRDSKTWYRWIPKPGGGFRRVSTGCTDKKAAEIIGNRLEREAADPAHAAQAKARTVDALDELLRQVKRKGRSPATYSFNEQKAGHLRRLLPAKCAQITHLELQAYVDARTSEGAARSTIKKELGVLRAALRLARRNGLFARETSEVMPDVEDDYRPRTRWLTPWELVALCQQLPTYRAAHVAFIVATGARWGESVRAEACDANGTPPTFWKLRGTKTRAAARTIPVLPMFAPALVWSLAHAEDGRLFPSWGNARRDLGAACAAAGIAACSPNDLRRTHSRWLRDAGVETGLIAAQLGHTTSRMVDLVYGKLPSESLGKLLLERTPKALTEGTPKPPPKEPPPALHMDNIVAKTGLSEADVTAALVAESSRNPVARPGVEPGTRGFSILGDRQSTPTDSEIQRKSWRANGCTLAANGGPDSSMNPDARTFRSLAWWWFRSAA